MELHGMLFPENEKWCIGWNGFFDEIHKQAIERETEGVKINMPQPTDHLFFQFCHARKHLLASGYGRSATFCCLPSITRRRSIGRFSGIASG